MTISASLVLLTAMSNPVPADITPLSLAVPPRIIEHNGAPYDWAVQQRRREAGQRLVAGTAHCNTGPTPTNIAGKADQVPDCGFD